MYKFLCCVSLNGLRGIKYPKSLIVYLMPPPLPLPLRLHIVICYLTCRLRLFGRSLITTPAESALTVYKPRDPHSASEHQSTNLYPQYRTSLTGPSTSLELWLSSLPCLSLLLWPRSGPLTWASPLAVYPYLDSSVCVMTLATQRCDCRTSWVTAAWKVRWYHDPMTGVPCCRQGATLRLRPSSAP